MALANLLPVRAIYLFYRQGLDFDGRTTQPHFWWAVLYMYLIMFLFILGAPKVVDLVSPGISYDHYLLAIEIAWLSFVAFHLVPQVSLCILRFRDAGWSPWWLLIGFVPGGALLWLWVWCQPSKD